MVAVDHDSSVAAVATESTALLSRPPPTTTKEPPPPPTTTTSTTTTTRKTSRSSNRGLVVGRTVSRLLQSLLPNVYGRHASLAAAWDYLEETILPRRLTNTYKKASSGIGSTTAAAATPPGRRDDKPTTELYDAWTTPQSALASFGTGIAVYFATLRILAVILLVAYLLYLPSIWFYASPSYDPANAEKTWYDAPLRGSLMCRNTVWVPCFDCPVNAFLPDRLAFAVATSETVVSKTTTMTDDAAAAAISSSYYYLFAMKNDCSPIRWSEGVNHLVVVVFVTLAMIALGFYQKQLELRYDESVLTASDFSIVVLNPPVDAVDASEWKTYFDRLISGSGAGGSTGGSSMGHVVYCTIALDNAPLVDALVQRRACLLQAMHQDDTHKDYVYARTIVHAVPERIRTTSPALAQQCDAVEAKCRELLLLQQQQQVEEEGGGGSDQKPPNNNKKKMVHRYGATKVFVTFDTEKSQRDALRALMSRDPIHAFRRSHGPHQQQQRQHILQVQEAMEPSVVRWQDLHATRAWRWTQRGLGSLLTVFFMYLSLHTVWFTFRNFSVEVAALVVALFSSAALPFLDQVNRLEQHAEESSYQASLFCKLMAFRFVNTVVTTMLITPFTETVGEKRTSLIPAIYAVLQAEVIVTPLVNMLDPVGHCNRLFLAPLFAKNQAAMNSYFKGSPENFGNKYTNMTKIVFLCFFYATIFPSGLLFGAVALVITYFTDKFLLLRTWAPIPELGNNVARLSRRVVFPLCLIVLLLMSELYWSAYPFDDVCEKNETVGASHTGIAAALVGVPHTLFSLATHQPVGQLVVDETDRLYGYCDQNYLVHLSGLLAFFEMETGDWMSDDQQYLTYLFGLVCFAFATILIFVECKYDVLPLICRALWGMYHTQERDSKSKFSEKRHIRVYVPQATHPLFSFPLLACNNMEAIEPSRIGWTDATRGHSYYSLHKDVEYLTDGKTFDRPVLSIVQSWE